jgi:hypothetical protein
METLSFKVLQDYDEKLSSEDESSEEDEEKVKAVEKSGPETDQLNELNNRLLSFMQKQDTTSNNRHSTVHSLLSGEAETLKKEQESLELKKEQEDLERLKAQKMSGFEEPMTIYRDTSNVQKSKKIEFPKEHFAKTLRDLPGFLNFLKN